MAVRHGYGKIAGADALVFAYDTGDTINSYRGEPTENIANTDSSRTMITHAGSSTFSDAPEKGPGWKKITITARSSNFRVTRFPYISQPQNTTRTYSVELDFGTTSGYYVRGDGFTGFGSSSSTNGIYSTTFTTTTNSGVLALFLNNNTTSVTGLNDVIYYRYYQVEDKAHRTPFTEGTRSATQGLLDLAGNSTIDLSNVSFDSNAQKTFDGTDDYTSIPNNTAVQLSTDQPHTLEYMLYMNVLPSSFYATMMKGSFSNSYGHLIQPNTYKLLVYLDGDSGVEHASTYAFEAQKWIHVVTTFEGGTSKIYINGELDSTQTGISLTTNTSPLYIGSNGGTNYYLNGKIDSAKIYNRALTPAEVQSNYRHYKKRFNI